MQAISTIDNVSSIGKSGGEALPEHVESDIDIYVFCDEIPDIGTRKTAVHSLGDAIETAEYNENAGCFWGTIDFVTIADTEICLMYFTVAYMTHEIDSVLNGSRLEKEAGFFYPTGRCATMLSMHVFYEKTGYIAAMKERLSGYPPDLSKKLFDYHIHKANDAESFQSAVSKADVLFYHEVLENALDHLLQALFALNKCFFPSRKRNATFIRIFKYKPDRCVERMLEVIELGARPATLLQSYEKWKLLYD